MKPDVIYPYNLLDELFGEPYRGIVDEDIQKGIDHIIDGLSEREASCIRGYYEGGETLDEVAGRYHVTRERIRQVTVKAMRKLRHPSRAVYITKGYAIASGELASQAEARYSAEIAALEAMYSAKVRELMDKISAIDKRIAGEASESTDEILAEIDAPIENMDLSVRAYNVLKRAGIKTLYDICGKTYAELCGLRNMGKKTIEEILVKIESMGFKLK